LTATPQRGDVWRVDFGRPTGHEQGAGARPAVVVSTDELNDTGAGLVIVAPLTTAQRGYPSRVRIRPGPSGLSEVSWAAVEHLRSLSTRRLQEYRGAVGSQVLVEIERVMQLLLFDHLKGAGDPS
jgi:mRNA interferase MazF